MISYHDHVNVMRQFLVTYGLVLFFVVGLCSLVGAEVFVAGAISSEKQRSLGPMVRDYVKGSAERSSDELLTQILAHPDANLQAVEAAIRQIPRYSKAPVGAQPKRLVKVRDQDASFSLYVPPTYTPDRAYPLIVCLHGAGFSGEAYLDRWVPRLEDRYILACPTISMGAWWTRFGEDLAMAVLKNVSQEYHVDPDRVFLTGMSNGGIGTWIIGMHYADRFAGLAPMASGIDDVLFPFLKNLTQTPVYVIHGIEDQVMPVQLSRDLVKEMTRLGIPHLYREHSWTHPHAGGHFFPRQELPELIAWFDQQRRMPLPQQVTVVRDATHLAPLFWVRIDATDQIAAFSENLVYRRDRLIRDKVYAHLHAEMAAPNTIEVRTEHVRRYTLLLNEELVDFSQPIVVKTNGIPSFEGIVKSSIEILLREGRRSGQVDRLFSATIPITVQSSE